MEDKPFWQVTAPDRPQGQVLDTDLTCDVAIIGAGFTGLCAALDLAEAGSDVVVFDAEDVGFGASGRSGGQVNPMLTVKRPGDLRKAVGDTYFERMAEVSLASADALFALVKKYNIDCEARQKGWIRADHNQKAKAISRAAAEEWNRFGAGFEFLDGAEIERLTGSPTYDSGTVSAKGGAVQPLGLVRGLAKAAEAAGAKIYAKARAENLERVDQRWRMSVGGKSVRADRVILTTNGYTDGLFSGLKRAVLALSPIQIATGPLSDDELSPVLPEGHTISDTRRLTMYSRREPNGSVIFGGIGYQRLVERLGGFQWLLRDAPRVFPSIKPESWRYRWGGRIALTADSTPHLHEPAPGLVAGMGYNGRGVAMSLVMGKVLADATLGAEVARLPFPVSPVEPIAFQRTQVFGAGVAMHALRMRDRMELG